MFTTIKAPPGDRLLAVMQSFRADPRPGKIDLCVGVYMDDAGRVPIMPSVKEAERRVIAEQTTKTYVSPLGDPVFCDEMQTMLMGRGSTILAASRLRTLQTPGGSGALRVGADFLRRHAPGATIWMSDPTWANHIPIFRAAGLSIAAYPYWDARTNSLDFGGMMTALAKAAPGDVVLLHACCHNPTGIDLSLSQWEELSDLAARNSLLPFVDCAYQGFSGGLEEDVAGLRLMACRVPEMLIAQSCSKSFGIYRERCGALCVMTETAQAADRMLATLAVEVRNNYSMPPAHGAEIVAAILSDEPLRRQWEAELTAMRDTLRDRRSALRRRLEGTAVAGDWAFLTEQSGMFSYTGFAPDQIERLRRDHAVYIAEDGRINIAGISPLNMAALATKIAAVVKAPHLTSS